MSCYPEIFPYPTCNRHTFLSDRDQHLADYESSFFQENPANQDKEYLYDRGNGQYVDQEHQHLVQKDWLPVIIQLIKVNLSERWDGYQHGCSD